MTEGAGRRIVFFGSPEAAVVVLDALVSAGHEIVGVVTQPPRRRGRGSVLSPTPVEAWSKARGLPVVHGPSEADRWCNEADLGVVVAYGRLIPARLLDACPMLNVHFSALPRWRGAAPVERAILAGDAETGVSIMELEESLDTGATFAVRTTPIRDDDTCESLTSRLAVMGAAELMQVLAADHPPKTPQRGDVTYASKIEPGERIIDWSRDSASIRRQVRALDAWCWFGDRRLGIRSCSPAGPEGLAPAVPGTVSRDGRVLTGDGALLLGRVRPEGKREMEATAWLSGVRTGSPVVLADTRSLP